MKKILLTLVFTAISFMLISCSTTNEIGNGAIRKSIESNDDDSQSENLVDQKKALKLYKKYLPKVTDLIESHGLTVRNLKENINDLDMVSRIVVIDSIDKKDNQDIDNEGESIWFGITYDEENLISELGMYIEHSIDLSKINNSLSLEGSIIEGVEKLFFKRENFLQDVEDVVLNYDADNVSETKFFNYKKGDVEMSVGQDKIIIKISLNL